MIPKEHTRNLNKVVLVDKITPDPRIQIPNVTDLPGLYHPRQGNVQPWCEIALGALLTTSDGFFKRIAARLNFKPNLAYLAAKLTGSALPSDAFSRNQETSIRGRYPILYRQISRDMAREAGGMAV